VYTCNSVANIQSFFVKATLLQKKYYKHKQAAQKACKLIKRKKMQMWLLECFKKMTCQQKIKINVLRIKGFFLSLKENLNAPLPCSKTKKIPTVTNAPYVLWVFFVN
jgi:hypothetical protein